MLVYSSRGKTGTHLEAGGDTSGWHESGASGFPETTWWPEVTQRLNDEEEIT